MYRIVRHEELVPNVYLMAIEASAVAQKARPGQFVVLRVDDEGERIPITIADFDRAQGTISMVYLRVGTTTYKLSTLKVGDSLPTFVGPLGNPTHIDKFGTVVVIGGGVGTATSFPVARAMREAGNRVITIAGWRNKDLMFWADRLAEVSDELVVTTDDGSFGRKGVVTLPLQEMLQNGQLPNLAIAIGPGVMMKFVSLTTKPFDVKTVVSLNPIMIDGTGMCGGCRVEVGGKTMFACVDGPEFDGHLVDWDLLARRQRSYTGFEKQSLERYLHACRLNGKTTGV